MDKVQEDWEQKASELRAKLDQRTLELEKAIKDYQELQQQLLLQEKLASLGQLAAGIAHEIKNPINFINNFSELSMEYVDEINTELSNLGVDTKDSELPDLLNDIKANLEKILQHGKRTEGIVKSMLMHSRGGKGEPEPTDINSLLKEFVNLAFHGMRAGKNPINVSFEWQLSEDLPKVAVIPEDFSRVIVNLCNNAFDAMRSKLSTLAEPERSVDYQPVLAIRTAADRNQVKINIEDNGSGIPDHIISRILEPFFTTKKGKDGTGLGLSISHDIVKTHGGTMSISSKEGESTEFEIKLPALIENR
ncbi:HAMP domain-containing sensor histidine kinase [Algoriphagus halophytocola]|uniref:histidine kinase n=1 Tax=Algoriphagus halophytocola TaxID=2991499 RepID=A0ABY6MCG1_9BACT|nr:MULTISPECIES: HAMP domain-containing sensor histidine kinase [unclassified Algoriphagus]UZD21381.1 HAMP domain-containing histidine kinase [Algoriphagus sp. TR-M5]WBL42593.1 HAMP domain-containing sensor histidine kinase [Algoriphagus sp. TR-M9]